MAEQPEFPGETGYAWGHPLAAVPSAIDPTSLVWRCEECGTVRTHKQYYRECDCPPE